MSSSFCAGSELTNHSLLRSKETFVDGSVAFTFDP